MKHEEATLKTKTMIAASLKKFMAKKALGKITVSEIVADCNINRKTFYYHFEDIYDLLKWMLEQEAIEVVKTFDLLVDFEDALCFIIDYVRTNTHILNCAYDSMGRDEMKRFFYNDFSSIAAGVVNDCEAKRGLSVDEGFKVFLSDFLTEAVAGMLVNGFKNRNIMENDDTFRNAKVLIDALPDILKRAPAKK